MAGIRPGDEARGRFRRATTRPLAVGLWLALATPAGADAPVPPDSTTCRVVLLRNDDHHAYEVRAAPHGVTRSTADSLARAAGARLATIGDSTEVAILESLVNGLPWLWQVDDERNALGPWLGSAPARGPDGALDAARGTADSSAGRPAWGVAPRGHGHFHVDDWPAVPADRLLGSYALEWEDGDAVAPVRVVRSVPISYGIGPVPAIEPARNGFGINVSSLGDLDGDGVPEIAIGATGAWAADRGEVWIVWPDRAGNARRARRLVPDGRGLPERGREDRFGLDVAGLGDLDGDGVPDLAITSPHWNGNGDEHGELLIAFLRPDGSVRESRSILPFESTPGFPPVPPLQHFGSWMSAGADLDGDGVTEVAIGGRLDPRGPGARDGILVLFLQRDGSIREGTLISGLDGGMSEEVGDNDRFGVVEWIPDLDGDGVPELAAGAFWDDDAGSNAGAVWTLFLHPDGTVRDQAKITPGTPGLPVAPEPYRQFGIRVADLGDLDGDGVADLGVTACESPRSGPDDGAVWILFMRRDGTAHTATRLGNLTGGLPNPPRGAKRFGIGLASVELDGRPPRELLVGTLEGGLGCPDCGSVEVLFLEVSGIDGRTR